MRTERSPDQRRERGSSASRSASPRKFSASSVSDMTSGREEQQPPVALHRVDHLRAVAEQAPQLACGA